MKAVTVIKISFAIVVVLLICAVIAIFSLYNTSLKAYDINDKTTFEIEIPAGSTYYSISDLLYDKQLIKSKTIYKVYLKLNPPTKELKAGFYTVSRSMDLKTIISVLEAGGNSVNPDEIKITFREGLNMRGIAKVIAENTNNTEKDVFNLLKDSDYINGLISKYWFITDEIKDDEIFYPLEGYLFPNTYNFINKDVTVEEIFEVMLNEMDKQLTPLKEELEKSEYTVHEILTLASIIELEALNTSDRKNVSGVFYNRLNSNMSLGSDVTTYYAVGIDMGDRDLYKAEIEAVNAYNTRPGAMAGKLPVGAICNPSLSSIEAAIKPNKTSYMYFVADKNGKVYFTKTLAEHNQIIQKLKAEGLWFTY
jgi:UPF0755 protein